MALIKIINRLNVDCKIFEVSVAYFFFQHYYYYYPGYFVSKNQKPTEQKNSPLTMHQVTNFLDH